MGEGKAMVEGFSDKSYWIWVSSRERRAWAKWVCFRKEFFVSGDVSGAKLRITADSEYWVWVNGEWVGQGPARSFPWRWRYEEYEVTNFLNQGANVIGVLVLGSGISTFRYVSALAGLRGELEIGGEILVGTDSSWEWSPFPNGVAKRFKVSCQQGWQEPALVPDAEYGWTKPGFSGMGWQKARVVKETRPLVRSTTEVKIVDYKGFKKHKRFLAKGLPAWVIRVNLRQALRGRGRDASPRRVRGLVGIRFHVKRGKRAFFHFGSPWFWLGGQVRVNGKEGKPLRQPLFDFENGQTFEGTVRKGENFLVIKIDGFFHEWVLRLAVFGVEGEPVGECLVFRSRGRETAEKRLWSAKTPREWLSQKGVVALQEGSSPDIDLKDPFAETAYARERVPLPPLSRIEFPRSSSQGEATQYLLDLGEETVGYWVFDVEAWEGATLRANGLDAIQKGTLDFAWEMDNTCELQLREGRHTYRALRRRAGRYLLLQGQGCVVHRVTVLEARYPSREGGQFECDDEILTQAYQISRRTVALCSEDTYVDCPSYEQTFWVGDARNSSLVNYFSLGDWELARHSCLLAGESLERSPLVESHVPSGWVMIIPAWSLLWMQACWECFYYTGDLEFLRAVYPAMKKQFSSLLGYIDERGLLDIRAWNFCDWAPMDTPGAGVVTHNQGWLVLALKSLEKASARLGDLRTPQQCKKVISKVTEACNKYLWDEERKAYVDALRKGRAGERRFSLQTQCVLCLADIPRGGRRERLLGLLREGSKAQGFVGFGTPYFYFYLLELYEREGEFFRLLETVKKVWGMMLKRGATTCWEVLPGFMRGGRWTRSHCHGWSSAPAYFLPRIVGGIVPISPQFRKVRFSPWKEGCRWCHCVVPTPRGPIEVEWERKGSRFSYKVKTPKGIEVYGEGV